MPLVPTTLQEGQVRWLFVQVHKGKGDGDYLLTPEVVALLNVMVLEDMVTAFIPYAFEISDHYSNTHTENSHLVDLLVECMLQAQKNLHYSSSRPTVGVYILLQIMALVTSSDWIQLAMIMANMMKSCKDGIIPVARCGPDEPKKAGPHNPSTRFD